MKHIEPQRHVPRDQRKKPLRAGDEEDRQNLTQENGPENTGPENTGPENTGPENTGPVDPPMTTSIMQQP